MIRTILIEDERLIAEEFGKLLRSTSADTELIGTFSNVRDSVAYLAAHGSPDLIFSDVQLPDGLSFDIFSRVRVKSPVVFITGYDHFMINAFEHNGIDYLLKPVDPADLEKALLKYRSFEQHFGKSNDLLERFGVKKRSRLVVRRGLEYIALKVEDVALIYTENKVVFALDMNGVKYMLDKKLQDLEDELDPSVFFRANRQCIVNIGYIRSYKAYDKVKLQVDLTVSQLRQPIIISQETAPVFRKWICEH